MRSFTFYLIPLMLLSLLSAGLSPKHDTETGIFTWDLSLPAASVEKVDVAYEVTAGKFVKVNFE